MSSENSVAERILTDAAAGLLAVGSGKCGLDDFLDFKLKNPELRRSVGSLLFLAFRRKRQLDALLGKMAQKAPRSELGALLTAVMAQMLFQTGIAPQSAANIAVEVAKRNFGAGAGKFVNALLRRLLREKPEFSDRFEDVLPPAVLNGWRKRFSAQELQQLAEVFLSGAPFTFRAVGDCEPEREFSCRPAECFAPFRCFIADEPGEILESEALRRGKIYIQDPATTLAVSLTDFSKVTRALDVCAAPGGKSLMIAERLKPGASLVAADRSARRQKMTRENFIRHGFDFPVEVAEPQDLKGGFDLVLADVPCSNTGVFHRRPDALWRFSRKALQEVVALQKAIFDAAAERVVPGGELIYSTCSIEEAENRAQVKAFLERHPDFVCKTDYQLLPTGERDGAYAALLVRSAQSI